MSSTTLSHVHTPIIPYITEKDSVPELTWRSIPLGIALAVLMASANAYLALKMGFTVSACIPAAVISMAILRFFKGSNILENNQVQTCASAGEVLAMGLAFTIPALIMIGYWNEFSILTTMFISAVGGTLGVLMSVPLRRAMFYESNLRFPEGLATAEVLKSGEAGEKGGALNIALGALASATFQFCQTGFKIIGDGLHYWFYTGSTVVGGGLGFSTALMGAGYIIGFRGVMGIACGAALTWFVMVPVFGLLGYAPVDAPSAHVAAMTLWNEHLRTIGIGTMVFGGLWVVIELMPSLVSAIKTSLNAVKSEALEGSIPRTEWDIPFNIILLGFVGFAIPLFILFKDALGGSGIDLTAPSFYMITAIILVTSYCLSFLCGSVSAYMCGLVGSAFNPLSGVTIMAVLITSLILVATLGSSINFEVNADAAVAAAGLTILVAALSSCAAAVAGDNLQDLKSGQVLGATPWKQQVMLLIGVIAGSLTLAPVFMLLFEAYGFGDVMPREGMDPSQSLAAPKAALMAALAQAIFLRSMDWSLFLGGGCLAVVIILIDRYLKQNTNGWRLPTLAVAVGIYMPLDITMPLFLGGMVAYLADRYHTRKTAELGEMYDSTSINIKRRGMLLGAGFIAGEALAGVGLAIPFVIYEDTNVFAITPEGLVPYMGYIGFMFAIGFITWLYKTATTKVA